jgi:hypothetical protein
MLGGWAAKRLNLALVPALTALILGACQPVPSQATDRAPSPSPGPTIAVLASPRTGVSLDGEPSTGRTAPVLLGPGDYVAGWVVGDGSVECSFSIAVVSQDGSVPTIAVQDPVWPDASPAMHTGLARFTVTVRGTYVVQEVANPSSCIRGYSVVIGLLGT